MESKYIAYHFTVEPLNPGVEILLAELENTPFESFEETENGLSAYIQESLVTDNLLRDIRILSTDGFSISHTTESIAQVNWNEEWEKNFQPILVDDLCAVRAPFHPKTNAPFEIIIEPKMSFGTGHHETTHLMIQHLLDLDLKNKKVLDMGCGTAILAILAEMKGAQPIDAVDIDNWCYLNSVENTERNNCQHITAYEGDASFLVDQKYDVIIANINRNILLNDIPTYVKHLNPNGIVLLSGFYTEDIPLIDDCCQKNGLTVDKKREKNNWVGMKYVNL